MKQISVMLIGYARVSTQEQSPDLQTDALSASGCDRIFVDRMSGARANRPELAAALSHCRAGDTLVVWKLDRLGRTVRQLVAFVEELADRDIQFRSLSDSIDTGTPAGRFFFHVMAALAEMERGLIQERTRAGLEAAKARGRQGGRPTKLTEEQITHARLLAETHSIADVARSFGVSRSTLYRAFGSRP